MQLQVLSGGAAQGPRRCARVPIQGRDRVRHRRHVRCGRRHARQAARRRAGRPADPDRGPDRGAGAAGHVLAGSAADIGVVRTAMAVRAGDAVPPVGDAAALRTALLSGGRHLFPRPEAGDGRHPFRQGARRARHRRRRGHAAAAVPQRRHRHAALAGARGARPIGCTQVDRDPQHAGRDAGGPAAEGVRAGDRLHGRRVHPRGLAGPGETAVGIAERRDLTRRA